MMSRCVFKFEKGNRIYINVKRYVDEGNEEVSFYKTER